MLTTSVQSSVRDLLRGVPPCTPKCVFVSSINESLASLDLCAADGADQHRLVMLRWATPPRIDNVIQQVLDEFAAIAKSAWPSWFGLPVSSAHPDHESLLHIAANAGALPSWTSQAWDDCERNCLPLPDGFAQSASIKHLALAIDPDDLTVVFAVDEADSEDLRLDGICRVAQWLAAHTHARICVLLDRSLRNSQELASIDYEPLVWMTGNIEDSDVSGVTGHENKLRVWPVAGKPHPLSPGEQRLSRALEEDPLLAHVFRFNCPVTTSLGQVYFVDLLAEAEKAIVEIDGYTHHSNRVAFSVDRQRDYELQTSGFLVLRIPHDELMHNLNWCMEKVRRFILFRREHPHFGV